MLIPFALQSYQADSLPWSSQRLVNLYAEVAPPPGQAKTPVMLRPTPGLTNFASLATTPVRGMHVMAGVLYVVAGAALYSVSAAGVATSLGAIAGSGPVSMTDNGTQLCIVTNPTGYVYTTGGGLAAITDADYPGAATVLYLDGYGIFLPADAQTFYITSLLDFTSVDALDFASAESAPDKIVSAIVDHRELWLMGEKTVEVWVNTGAADFPFERLDGATLERGCGARFALLKEDNTVFWLGDDRVVYRAERGSAMRISTHAVDDALSGYADVADCEAFAYTEGGHKFLVFSFPSANATWVYDVATGLWHERKSGTADTGRWRARMYARAYGKHLVGDYNSGTVYELSETTRSEAGAVLQRIVDFPVPPAENRRMRHNRFTLDCEVGVGLTTGQGSDPQVMLKWSDDGGRTWSGEHWRTLGAIGTYRTRLDWRRMGQARQRVYRVTVSDPVQFAPYAGYADVVPLGY